MNEDNKDINLKNSLHTLEGDLLASMKDENYESNIVKIVSRENKKVGEIDKNPVAKPEDNRPKFNLASNTKILYLGISLFFVLLITGGSYYFINMYTEVTAPRPSTVATTTAIATTSQPIIQSGNIFNAEVVLPIKVASYNKNQFIERINQAKQELLSKKVKNRTNISLITDISLADFLNKIQYSGPESLIRSFPTERPYGFGLYHTQSTDFETYFIAKIDIFDLAFSGMLEWEESISIDLDKIYTYKPLATSTATSTLTVETKFTDKVIKNIDTRVYDDPIKGVRIIYGIVNKQYLLIASGENSFVDIVNKLLVNNVLR